MLEKQQREIYTSQLITRTGRMLFVEKDVRMLNLNDMKDVKMLKVNLFKSVSRVRD